jgi:hypothetical protein
MEKCQIYFNNRFFLAVEHRANHVVFSEGLLAGAVPKAILILLSRVSAPLQSGIRFLPHLLSAPPSVHLAMHFPSCGERCGLTLFRWNDAIG